jgi:hypothetical protein
MAMTSAQRVTGSSATTSNIIFDCMASIRSTAYGVSNYFLSSMFRDGLLMPLNGARKLPEHTKKACREIVDASVPDPARPQKESVLREFSVIEQDVFPQIGDRKYHLKLREFANARGEKTHTCLRIGGNDETLDGANLRIYPLLNAYLAELGKSNSCGLRILQFSFYGHECRPPGSTSKYESWKPSDAAEVGKVVFELIKELQKRDSYKIDSLLCNSLGSLVFEAVEGVDPALVPKEIILDRALPSVWKAGANLYWAPRAYATYAGAYIAGWGADPEKSLVRYFKHLHAHHQAELKGRRVILIEVNDDRYFSGAGAFDKGFIPALESTGIAAHRKCYQVNEIAFAKETNHSLASNHLINGDKKDTNTAFPADSHENLSTSLVKNVFLSDRQ